MAPASGMRSKKKPLALKRWLASFMDGLLDRLPVL